MIKMPRLNGWQNCRHPRMQNRGTRYIGDLHQINTLNKGKCHACHQMFGSAVMYRHLAKCKDANMNHDDDQSMFLRITGRNKDYWMVLRIKSTATLEDLDKFLRGIWLECCGHLSAFTIYGTRYVSTVDLEYDEFEEEMDAEVGSILGEGDVFSYEYDFGTTTNLDIKVQKPIPNVGVTDDPIEVLARNNQVDYPCSKCRGTAEFVCSSCVWDDAGFLCRSCGTRHKCGEDFLLKVANSPRVGMCAYGS